MLKKMVFPLVVVAAFAGCEKDGTTSTTTSNLQFKIEFDATQPRLNNIGLPATMPAGNAAQTPVFHKMSVHYLELAPGAFTQLGQGAIVYKGPETSAGGSAAVDFDGAAVVGAGELFAKISLKDIPPGIYEWVRASVTYQNYDIHFNLKNVPVIGDLDNQKGTIASFVGFNTFIKNITPNAKTLPVNDDKKQGFWAFETSFTPPYDIYNQVTSGEGTAGATTVVNPLAATSPIPAGSCVVTGKLTTPLVITGNETTDKIITLSFSINESFEWKDTNGNGQLDWYADGSVQSEIPVDMGLRGLIPSWK